MIGRMAVGMLVVLTAASCGGLTRRQSGELTPAPTVAVGSDLLSALPSETPIATGAAAKTAAPVSFVITVADDNQLHPKGIPVKMSGPVDRSFFTDAKGQISASVPVGFYRFEIPKGCHNDVIVSNGGSGKVGIVEGHTARGELLVLWQHRFGPSSPVFTNASDRREKGKKIDVSFAVSDRCSNDVAPGKSLSTFEYEPSGNLKVLGPPTARADAKGRSTVSVSCTAKGAVELELRDADNPTDRTDLIQLSLGFSGRPPRCE